ncbi:MAG TPA: nuclear transport factor 2 family protein [Pyrinomonadaceae bacterium]|nr:nuclear transport factor 2 family protein [Pyrinomonadaceae bacterium]
MAAPSASWSVSEAQSFIYEYFLAWEGTDEDLILSFYTDDVVAEIPGTRMEGKEALRDHFVRPFITAFPGNHHVVKNMIYGPNVIVVEWSFEAQHRGTFAGHMPTGAQVKVPGTGVYEYDAEKCQIISGRIYFDVGTLLQSIALVNGPKEAIEGLHLNDRSLIINTIPSCARASCTRLERPGGDGA